MNKVSCIIVDDEQDAIELLTARLGLFRSNVLVSATSSHWEDALQLLLSGTYDLLFLDISMPGKSGIELLKLLPRLKCEVIFVTAHEEYALTAFSLGSSGYVLKPIDDEQLIKAVDIAIERILTKRKATQQPGVARATDKIGISNSSGVDYVLIADIIYFEATNKCTRVVTTKGEYLSSNYLSKFQDQLLGYGFFQVHRSFVINLNAILRYEMSGVVIMSNKDEIPVSRNVRNELLEILGL